jgi:ankyrin repeat protein
MVAHGEAGDVQWFLEAVGHNRIGESRKCLEAGVDVNSQDRCDPCPTALHIAATKNYTEMADMLILAGADVNSHNYDGDQPLHKATVGRHLEMMRKLIDAGAEIDGLGYDGSNPLINSIPLSIDHLAFGDTRGMDLLLSAGADVNVKCFKNISKRNWELDGVAFTALMAAASLPAGSALAHLRKLLAAGADPNIPGGHHGSAILSAVHNGNLEALQVLIDAGADVEIVDLASLKNFSAGDNYGRTALHIAADPHDRLPEYAHPPGTALKMILTLLGAGAKVNRAIENNWHEPYNRHQGFTAAHFAAGKNFVPGLEALIHAGAEVDAKAKQVANFDEGDRDRVAHGTRGPGTVIKIIGDMVQVKYDGGGSVKQYPKEQARQRLTQTHAGTQGRTPFHVAVSEHSPEAIDFLLAQGADKDAVCVWKYSFAHTRKVDKRWGRAIHAAAAMGSHFLIEQLVGAGVDVTAQDQHGETALHLVIRASQTETDHAPTRECMTWLLDAGADVNARDKRQQTPLHVTISCHGQSRVAFDFLLSRGADANAVDDNQQTPFHSVTRRVRNSLRVMREQEGVYNPTMDMYSGRVIEKWGPSQWQIDDVVQQMSLLQALRDHGGDIQARDAFGVMPLHLVMRQDEDLDDIIRQMPNGDELFEQALRTLPFLAGWDLRALACSCRYHAAHKDRTFFQQVAEGPLLQHAKQRR